MWDGSCSHTLGSAGEIDPWWSVDLGKTTGVGYVRIANRQDSDPGKYL